MSKQTDQTPKKTRHAGNSLNRPEETKGVPDMSEMQKEAERLPGTQQTCIIPNPKLDAKEVEDIKYQYITYYYYDNTKSVKSKDKVKIDFIKAAEEMNSLNWNHEGNFIGFDNNKTRETLQFVRMSQDTWHADSPIHDGVKWDRYTWGCDAKTEDVMRTLRLFFEEVSWFDTLPFTMSRFKGKIT